MEIKNNVRIRDAVFWFEDEGGRISIGPKTTMETGCQFASVEGKNIIIGEIISMTIYDYIIKI